MRYWVWATSTSAADAGRRFLGKGGAAGLQNMKRLALEAAAAAMLKARAIAIPLDPRQQDMSRYLADPKVDGK
jgi:hypothetical protein